MENKQTILLVDDSKLNRDILKEFLTNTYNFLEAENGKEALEYVEDDLTIDLILLDINMPEMNGFEFLEHLKEKDLLSKTPIIMISAEGSNVYIEKCYKYGIVDYISRPFNELIVKKRIQNTLRLYTNQKKLTQMVMEQVSEKEESNNIMVEILSLVVETRNHESGGHIKNIRLITNILLKHLSQMENPYNLTEAQMAFIVKASSLHDIGKNAIPDSILNKTTSLTEEEFEIMKTHTTLGASFIEKAAGNSEKPLFKIARDICRWHHERWDGSGYPDGLMCDEIPISAQIVALADVYDALTSIRCYKGAYKHDTAIKMILSGECGAFNPILLDCLVRASQDIDQADFSSMEELNSHIKEQLTNELFRDTPFFKDEIH